MVLLGVARWLLVLVLLWCCYVVAMVFLGGCYVLLWCCHVFARWLLSVSMLLLWHC